MERLAWLAFIRCMNEKGDIQWGAHLFKIQTAQNDFGVQIHLGLHLIDA